MLSTLVIVSIAADGLGQIIEDATESHSIFRETLGPANLETLNAESLLGTASMALERYEQAAIYCRAAERGLRANPAADPPALVNATSCLGESLRILGRSKESVPHLERALSVARSYPAGMPVQIAQMEFALAQALTAANVRPGQAKAHALSALKHFDELHIEEESVRITARLNSLAKAPPR